MGKLDIDKLDVPDIKAINDENSSSPVNSICGMLDLVIALFPWMDKIELARRFGLNAYKCGYCGKFLIGKLFCSQSHYRRWLRRECYIDVVCDNCGKLFRRRASVILCRVGREGNQHMYCSTKCVAEAKRKNPKGDGSVLRSIKKYRERNK